MKKYAELIPGVAAAFALAFVAKGIESLIPVHIISAAVIAMFLGMIINLFRQPSEKVAKGLKFTSKKLLKFAIILLGASLSVSTIVEVGKLTLSAMIFTFLICFGIGRIVGKALGLNWKATGLISSGLAICGGSAIAAVAPTIEAEDRDVAYAMSAVFLFDMVMIVAFPLIGGALGLSDMAYGLWAGTAVNDTSGVVAAGYAFSEAAGDFATMVKLTRTLAIIPMVLVFAFINVRLKRKAASGGEVHSNVKMASVFPWFILGFVALAVINSVGLIPAELSANAKSLSKFLMVVALAAIGLNTSFKDMKKAGLKPIVYGLILTVLIIFTVLGVEFGMEKIGWLTMLAA